jgi:hypothetical protein
LAKTVFAALNKLAALGDNHLTQSATIRTTTTTSMAYLAYDKETGEFAFDATVEGTF